MRKSMDEALSECLNRIARGESVEASLRGYESMAAELRPMLQAALALQAKATSAPEFTEEAARNARARMQAERARQAESKGQASPWLPWRAVGLVAAAALAAVVAFVASGAGLPDFGGDAGVAQAQGVVSSSATDSVVLTTADGQIVIRIGENTVVLDANGNVIHGEQIAPGTRANIQFEKEDDGLSGLKIEVEGDEAGDTQNDDSSGGPPQGHGPEVEFSGVIQSIDANTLVLSTGFGPATVRIEAGTEVKGSLQVGATVKVHATRESNGGYIARELEVAEAEDGGGAEDSSGDSEAPGGSEGDGGSGSDDSDSSERNSGELEPQDGSDDAAPEPGSSDGASDGEDAEPD